MNYKFFFVVIFLSTASTSLAQKSSIGLGITGLKSPFVSYSLDLPKIRYNVQLTGLKAWENTIKPYYVDTADFIESDTLTLNLYEGVKRKPTIKVEVNAFKLFNNKLMTGIGIGFSNDNKLTRRAEIDAGSWQQFDNDSIAQIGAIKQQDSSMKQRQMHISVHLGFYQQITKRLSLMVYFSTTFGYKKSTLEVRGYDRISYGGGQWNNPGNGYKYSFQTNSWWFQPLSRPTVQLIYTF